MAAEGGAVMTRVMGIVNVTPDSMADGGKYVALDAALAHAHTLVAAGADIVDVGGEATSPGRSRVPVEVEQQRVLPVVKQLVEDGISVSVDTMNGSTAEKAIELGARLINDVSGGSADPAILAVIAQADPSIRYVVTHWRGHSDTANEHAHYGETVDEVLDELRGRVDAVVEAGVAAERVIIDPGFGFSKMSAHNWDILAQLGRFIDLGFPVLVGVSRKRFMGALLPADASMEARDIPTAVITGILAGTVWGVRVHNVAGSVAAIRVSEELSKRGAPVRVV